MKFNTKHYKTIKTKNYFRKNNLILLFNGVNKNQEDWLATEQNLTKIKFNYYKVFNKAAAKTLEKSIINHISKTIHGVTFLVKPQNTVEDLPENVPKKLEPLSFILISLKLNTKVYSNDQIKKAHSLNYRKSKLLLYQFGITNLKSFNPIEIM